MTEKIRVTVWNEFLHEKTDKNVKDVYPDGMHATIAKALKAEGDMDVRTAILEEPEHGLTEAVLKSTDVLTWWGHMAHDKVDNKIVDRVQKNVLEGMGLICLHSAHFSKIFRRVLGTTCTLKWREVGERSDCGISLLHIPLPRESANTLNCHTRKCTVSVSIYRSRINSSSSHGSKAARSSVAAAAGNAGMAASFTSDPVTKHFPFTMTRMS